MYRPYHYLLETGGAKAASPALRGVQVVDLEDVGRGNLLQHQLGNPVALLDVKVDLGKVEQDDPKGAAVVGINDTGADINKVLDSQTGARGNAAVVAGGDGNGDVSGNAGLALGRDNTVLGRAQVVAGSKAGATDREAALGRELLDEEGRAGSFSRHSGG